MMKKKMNKINNTSEIQKKVVKHCLLLLRHPGGVFEGQLGAPDLLLAQVDVFPELSDGIQRGVVLKTQPADLRGDEGRGRVRAARLMLLTQESKQEM